MVTLRFGEAEMCILWLAALFCVKTIIKEGRVDAAVHAIREDRERESR